MTGTKKFTFDLKGSHIGRKVHYVPNAKTVLKDVNFLELNKKDRLVKISFLQYYELQKVIKSDSEFLLSQGIMDYSMLLVVEEQQQSATASFTNPSFTNPAMHFSGEFTLNLSMSN
jgi:hypothetical protein